LSWARAIALPNCVNADSPCLFGHAVADQRSISDLGAKVMDLNSVAKSRADLQHRGGGIA